MKMTIYANNRKWRKTKLCETLIYLIIKNSNQEMNLFIYFSTTSIFYQHEKDSSCPGTRNFTPRWYFGI